MAAHAALRLPRLQVGDRPHALDSPSVRAEALHGLGEASPPDVSSGHTRYDITLVPVEGGMVVQDTLVISVAAAAQAAAVNAMIRQRMPRTNQIAQVYCPARR